METVVDRIADEVRVRVAGEVDSDTAPKLDATFAAMIADGCTTLTVDVS